LKSIKVGVGDIDGSRYTLRITQNTVPESEESFFNYANERTLHRGPLQEEPLVVVSGEVSDEEKWKALHC
jgi:hypothetical protein